MIPAGAAEGEICLFCDAKAATHTLKDQEFVYKDGGRAIVLHTKVPVVECSACGEAFNGEGAEEAQHAAVCAYLGRLTPAEIRGLRERLGLTQARLAELTQIGIASIKRWEAGNTIQNPSLDAKLRALDTGNAMPAHAKSGFRFQFEPRVEDVEASRRFSLRTDYSAYAEAA
ncbi:MAG: hypothetical protein A2095_04680 [Sphingomonadales bacterium GWF1_63_6]|nr:MAG: hypothetical protein A2095_04680 [Sphingomonadales bacterium GWF1_63_6]